MSVTEIQSRIEWSGRVTHLWDLVVRARQARVLQAAVGVPRVHVPVELVVAREPKPRLPDRINCRAKLPRRLGRVGLSRVGQRVRDDGEEHPTGLSLGVVVGLVHADLAVDVHVEHGLVVEWGLLAHLDRTRPAATITTPQAAALQRLWVMRALGVPRAGVRGWQLRLGVAWCHKVTGSR